MLSDFFTAKIPFFPLIESSDLSVKEDVNIVVVAVEVMSLV